MSVWGCRCGAFGGLLYEVEGNIPLPPTGNRSVEFEILSAKQYQFHLKGFGIITGNPCNPTDAESPQRQTLAQRLIYLQFP